jgi:23S rRNA (uracil1939-C5)-methyltransferase
VEEGKLDLTIEKLIAGGDGLGFINGMAVFVAGTIPGEKVRVRVTERHKDYCRSALVEVISPSPSRQTPPCALAGICGGCDWLHIRYEDQLEGKVEITREALRRVGGIERGRIEIEPGFPLGYRSRVRVHRDERGMLGFMGFRSSRVVPVRTCPVAAPGINRVFPSLRSAEPSSKGPSRFTVFSGGERVAIEGLDDGDDLEVTVCGKRIVFSIQCFFQSNLGMLEKLVPFAVAGLKGEEGAHGGEAADLYCGVGVFSVHMAPLFRKIIAVESDPRSLSYAGRNLAGSGGECHALPVERWIETEAEGLSFDAVLADPPRAGFSRQVKEYLVTRKPKRLVYVSCNPVTLARDLGFLVRGGFRVLDLRLFDFFPQTSHVESVAWLEAAETAGR